MGTEWVEPPMRSVRVTGLLGVQRLTMICLWSLRVFLSIETLASGVVRISR